MIVQGWAKRPWNTAIHRAVKFFASHFGTCGSTQEGVNITLTDESDRQLLLTLSLSDADELLMQLQVARFRSGRGYLEVPK
jgi:hypothetical protein